MKINYNEHVSCMKPVSRKNNIYNRWLSRSKHDDLKNADYLFIYFIEYAAVDFFCVSLLDNELLVVVR